MTVCAFLNWLNWNAITAIATLATAAAAAWAAFSARRAAVSAENQLEAEMKWRKRDRVFYHSPYRNDKLLNAIRALDEKYKYKKQTNAKYEENANSETVKNIEVAANLFGQMATEYVNDLLDKELAKKVLSKNYILFCRYFKSWLGERIETYPDTLALYDEWREKH